MAKILMGSCAAAVFLLIGCGEQKQTAVEPVLVVSIAQQNREIAERLQAQMAANEKKSAQEGEIAERQRMVSLLQAPIDRWFGVFVQLPGKGLTEVGVLSAQMQAIQAEIGAVATTACTESKRAETLKSMEALVALLGEFRATRGEAGADFPNRLGEAFTNVERNSDSLATCT